MRLLPCLAAACGVAFAVTAQNTGIQLQTGVDGYLEVPHSTALVPPSGITVEAWITYDDTTLPTGFVWPTVARQDPRPASESWFLRVQAGNTLARTLRFKVVTSVGQGNAQWTFTPGQLLTWTHVAGTYDGTTVRLFVNGNEVGSGPMTGRLVDLGGALRIGKGDDAIPAGEVWNGGIDELRIWPFARTQAEIAATMNQELTAVPGLVSTFNLNNTFGDGSAGLVATAVGSVPFAANPLALSSLPISGALPHGASTPTCTGPIRATISALPQVGNGAFAVVGTRAAASANGALMFAFAPLPAAFPILGFGLWIDVTTGFLVSTGTSAIGAARVGLPVPPTPSLAGGTFWVQFAFLDGCAPLGLTASDALRVVLLP